MKTAIALLTVASLAACSGVSPTATNSATNPSGSTTPVPADNASFGKLLNDVRTANGAADVVFDARLAGAAQTHADDMLANDFLGHFGSDGSSVGDRAHREGYNWTTIGENVAQGQADEASVLASWTASPPHHANDISPAFQDFGLGKAGSGSDTRWALVLGSE